MERDFNNDSQYKRPRAWRDFKKLFGKYGHLHILAERLERIARLKHRNPDIHELISACPRRLLCAAIHHFARSDRATRARYLREYSHWIDSTEGKKPPQPWPEGDVTSVPDFYKALATQNGYAGDSPDDAPGLATETPCDDGRYVEHGGRIYELVTCDGFPRGHDGRECKCVLDLMNQRVLFAPDLTPAERADLTRRAFAKWELHRQDHREAA